MTTNKDLGTRKKVDLREVWPNEERDFTPWLAENLLELGDALGLDLELQRSEASVGSYRLDILARDLGSGRPVVIENQLESTDRNHTHLGQLLTYAAGFDANVIVWIAKEFRDEHREALNWLNHRTDEDTQFFGVEVELWKIDNSRPAVNFKLVATPNEWQKQTVSNARAASNVSERNERYRAFFQKLADTLREKHNFTNLPKAQPRNWYNFSTEYGHGVWCGPIFRAGKKAKVEVDIDSNNRAWNKEVFDKLKEQEESIESELGESLEWDRLDEKKPSCVSVVRDGSINDNEETLEEIRSWMVEKLLDFKRVFGPRLDELAR